MTTQFTPFTEYIKTRPEASPLSPKDGFQVQQYHKGDTIFTMGARGHAAYVVKSGQVEISIPGQGKKTVLTVLGEQAVFGEVALLTGCHTRSATATAIEDATIIRIPKEVFDQYLKKSPKVISSCLVAIAKRLNEFSSDACAQPAVMERIVRILALLNFHDRPRLDHAHTLDALSGILARPKPEVAKDLAALEDFNLLEIEADNSGQGVITLLGKDRFLEKALKVISLLKGVEPA